jgi:hypothetical protein
MRALITAMLMAAAQPAVSSFAGSYEIDQMEMAGGLELRSDGTFQYALDYGAVSEEAQGKWAVEDGTVLLTTDPMPPKAKCDRGFASACFDRTPLGSEDGNLVLKRWDARILLQAVQPRPR